MFIEIENSHIDNFKNRSVILFGAGSCGLHVLEEFQNRNITILAFCDNNHSLTSFKGYPVIQPTQLKKYKNAAIIITSTFIEEISAQLNALGIHDFHIARAGVLRKTIDKAQFQNKFLSELEANQFIYNALVDDKPFFVGRIGSVELECLSHYLYFLERCKKEKNKPYPANVSYMMHMNAGFFPPDDLLLDKFCELYINDMKEIDLFWSMWLSKYEDMLYHDLFPNTMVSEYDETYLPIPFDVPWSTALKDKKVLVIHPFEASIKENFKKRMDLFETPFLPDFELVTLKAVQSIAGTTVSYSTWFDALDDMKQQIKALDFDIALIGAGAYGFSLGAYIKRLGKKAVHVGGALQLYFGIKGKAWDKLNIYNSFWTNPKQCETPKKFKEVEAGRYW